METQDMDRLMAFRLTPKLVAALKKEAARRHTSMSAIVRQALLSELSNTGMPDLVREAVREVMESALDKAVGKLRKVS